MSVASSYVRLAESLPPRLLRFFTRYQPQRPATSSITSSVSQSATQSNEISSVQCLLEPSSLPNPFKSQKNLVTGRWQEPIYSLRRQADLVKLARAHGVEELLPPTTKGTEARIQKRAVHGLQVKGTGVGQRVKGKGWERTQKGRLHRRKQAMLQMPQMIHDWKQVSWNLTDYGPTKLIMNIERAWTWLEEISQMTGLELFGCRYVVPAFSTFQRLYIT
jgi:large subunit ribosomal protein L25